MPTVRTSRKPCSPAKLLRLPLMLSLGSIACHSQTLPATTPTTPAAAPSGAAAAPSISQSNTQSKSPAPAQQAKIQFSNGILTVNASNSSLNQILRDIAHLTGMTITGGVTDERVFGVYGPADTATILTALLDGTGSNLLIVQGHGQSPRELVLTPRQGGPTPPSPASYSPPSPQQQYNPPPQYVSTPQNQNMINRDNPQQPPVQQPVQQEPLQQQQQQPPVQSQPLPDPAAPAGSTPADTTTQQSPNGVKTPQQIYEQLMKMQQQTAKPPQ